jgi:hypothetical protein
MGGSRWSAMLLASGGLSRVVRCRTPSGRPTVGGEARRTAGLTVWHQAAGRHVLSGATAEAVGSDRTAPSRSPISGGITSKPTDATKQCELYGGRCSSRRARAQWPPRVASRGPWLSRDSSRRLRFGACASACSRLGRPPVVSGFVLLATPGPRRTRLGSPWAGGRGGMLKHMNREALTQRKLTLRLLLALRRSW